MKKFFINRVIEPASSLPVSAWKLDSNKDITENEMLIKVVIRSQDRDVGFERVRQDVHPGVGLRSCP